MINMRNNVNILNK